MSSFELRHEGYQRKEQKNQVDFGNASWEMAFYAAIAPLSELHGRRSVKSLDKFWDSGAKNYFSLLSWAAWKFGSRVLCYLYCHSNKVIKNCLMFKYEIILLRMPQSQSGIG